MNGTRREWILLSLTLVGAGTGQWIWLTRQLPFAAGLACYGIAVLSWRRLTPRADFRHRPYRKALMAWAGGGIFGTLAFLVFIRDPGQTPIALLLLAIALVYFAWAVSRGQGFKSIRQTANRGRTKVSSRGWLRHAIRTTVCPLAAWIKRTPPLARLYRAATSKCAASLQA